MESHSPLGIYYGKDDVYVYRTCHTPLRAWTRIHESPVEFRDQTVFGARVRMAVEGDAFLPSFRDGDNRDVIATDSMKNFLLRHAALYEGPSLDGYLAFAGRCFLETYPHVRAVELYADEQVFRPVPVPGAEGFEDSTLVFLHSRNEWSTAELRMERHPDGSPFVVWHRSGLDGLHLIKIRGNSFVGYIRDEYTTLPEDSNRPLYVFLSARWTYVDPLSALSNQATGYILAEQIRDLAGAVFHALDTRSIQHLIHRICALALLRFPQLESITFQSQNRTWERIVETADGRGQVYTEPRPPFGFQGITMTRADLAEQWPHFEAEWETAT
ncbi:factor-independent urate hydroxylase [Alicyclobacillus mali (ex Roth et al. 2021)]|uniref:factor-independent urate hydroxylase n=1 Tax=Alicyclobacillus mali (ex Roth et al. 2021) TaxID=1123961 RepID=UPI000829C895|nr:urate oxidase [Alicyclobacillus mali (ex Roth et al. 2021)]